MKQLMFWLGLVSLIIGSICIAYLQIKTAIKTKSKAYSETIFEELKGKDKKIRGGDGVGT